MGKQIALIILLFAVIACDSDPKHPVKDVKKSILTQIPIQHTSLRDLPDSLNPKVIDLKSMPDPIKLDIKESFNINENIKEDHREIGKLNITQFTSDDGLPLDGISHTMFDKAGNLWIGTFGNGASCYNGKSFNKFTPEQGLGFSSNISHITEDKFGNIWFATYGGGVSRFDGTSFTNFTTTNGLANDNVGEIYADRRGNVWFGTESGLSCFNGKNFKTFTTANGLSTNNVNSICEDLDGNLWIGTFNGGLCRFDGKSFTVYTTENGLASNIVNCVLLDKNGSLWIGTIGGGVSHYEIPKNGKDGKFTNYTTADGLAKNGIWCMAEDHLGNIWFGTFGNGVTRYEPPKKGNPHKFTTFTRKNGLANDNISSISEDPSGNIWFGTFGGGISRFNGKTFTNFNANHGLADNNIRSIAEDESGNMWFGGGGGLSKYDGNSLISYALKQNQILNRISSIAVDNQLIQGNRTLWLGTYGGGLIRFDGKYITNYTIDQGLTSNNISCTILDHSGRLWIGTANNGLCRIENQTITQYSPAQGLAHQNVMCIKEDKSGILWIGTDGGGISRFDGNTFWTLTKDHGLASNETRSISLDESGNLWVGTVDGLSVLPAHTINTLWGTSKSNTNITNSHGRLFKSYTSKNGLPDNFVTQLFQEPNGKMVIGTNLGIAMFNWTQDFSQLYNFEIFNTQNGYPVKEINSGQNAMYLNSKGIIWAGTGSERTALVRFDYQELNLKANIIQPTIHAIKINDNSICWYNLLNKKNSQTKSDSSTRLLQEYLAYGRTLDNFERDSIQKQFGDIQFSGITRYYSLPTDLVLPYAQNHISFDFVGIETDKPQLVQYQYMLEGYDKNWHTETSLNRASFGNIREGTYTFKLKTKGYNGKWSEVVSYSFKVLPPWYRTIWAYVSYCFLFIFTIKKFSNWRERKLKEEKTILELTVKERTFEVLQEKNEAEKQKEEANKQRDEAQKQHLRSDELLLNILPQEVAEELKSKGSSTAKHFENVTVMFTDFKNFTQIAEKLTPQELVNEIHTCFKTFDQIIEKYNIEKIKTIGDAYMCVGGLPVSNNTHARDVVNAALEIQQYISLHAEQKLKAGKDIFEIRIGVHTGPVVAGIVGIKKFAYDIWGDTVNIASRMESSGEVGKVNISESTYAAVKDQFHCTYRGKIKVKNKGEMDMYFAEHKPDEIAVNQVKLN